MNTNSIKIKHFLIIIFSLIIPLFLPIATHATVGTILLPNNKIKPYAYNSIYFYTPCIPGGGNISSICGNTAKEKYWSALRAAGIDNLHIAGIFGSIDHEGAFGPTKWQYNVVAPNSNSFQKTWEQLYNSNGSVGGVGSFQITWELSRYLHEIEQNNPDLLKYFKDASYSLDGEPALAKIGASDFDRLVQQEVDFVLKAIDKSSFLATNTVEEAADWWTKNYENCDDCCGSADPDKSCGQIGLRRSSAEKNLDDMESFNCSGSSSSSSPSSSTSSSSSASSDTSTSHSSTSSVSGSDITWIGDSYSVAAHTKGLLPTGIDIGSGTVNTSSSYIQDSKTVSANNDSNPSCLNILQKIINSNALRPYLVFACGTNGGWSSSDISQFQNLLKNQETIAIVVNSKIPNDNYNESNARLQQMADTNDDIFLADWVSAYKADYFTSNGDKIHPYTDPGFKVWTETITNALSNAEIKCTTYEGDYPSYPQCDSKWSDVAYGRCSMCECSCGASSMAMLATMAANQDILPTDIANILGGTYYYNTSGSGMSALDKQIGDHYGFEVTDVPYSSLSDAENKMKQYLNDGYMIHLSGSGGYPFSSVGHYIGIFGWTNKAAGKVMLANSGGHGNREESLHDVIYAGLHGGSFSVIKNAQNAAKCNNTSANYCEPSNISSGIGSGSVLNAVKEILELANKNGSTYTWGGGHSGDRSEFDAMLNGSPVDVDCTGFASLVMYKTFGKMTSFTSESIFNDPLYEEISSSDIQPGDIFAYNSPSGHGGIIIEVSNGKITKIAETGGAEGKSGNNTNIGYSDASDFSVINANSSNGHFFHYKGV